MEKLKLHQEPFVNSNNIYVQSVSTSKSNSYLFANAYGVSEKQAKERGKLISCAPEILEALILLANTAHLNNDLSKKVNALIKKATE